MYGVNAYPTRLIRDKTDVPEARAAKHVLHAPNRDVSFRLGLEGGF